jgi:hypothetical protein
MPESTISPSQGLGIWPPDAIELPWGEGTKEEKEPKGEDPEEKGVEEEEPNEEEEGIIWKGFNDYYGLFII